jgi:hypothetical protein
VVLIRSAARQLLPQTPEEARAAQAPHHHANFEKLFEWNADQSKASRGKVPH